MVILIPQAVPFTCRIPKQVRQLREAAQKRRASARAEVEGAGEGAKVTLQARILGLVSGMWDKIGWVPGGLAKSRVEEQLEFLVRDDRLIMEGGGVEALEEQEVVMACLDRGIDTVDRDVEELRRVLESWLKKTTEERLSDEERIRRVEELIMKGEEKW